MKNYKLCRNIVASSIVAASLVAPFKAAPSSLKYSYSLNDQIKNGNILGTYTNNSKLEQLPEEVQSTILYKKICEKYNVPELTRTIIDQITKLNIDEYLEDGDYSLIKYLTNLEELSVKDCTFIGRLIKYNLNLKRLNFENCNVQITSEIPNSVEEINLERCISKDNAFVVPYNVRKLNLINTLFNNITLKNPSTLEELNISSWSELDLNCIKDCNNLHTLSILYDPNVKNDQVLCELPNLKNIELDEYASVWINNDTLKKINYNDQKIKKLLFNLDITAEEITEDCKDNNDKIRAIVKYILHRLEYDNNVENNPELANTYYQNPISSLEQDKGISINYATLFQALAKRNGLDSFMQYNNENTWNIVKDNDNKEMIIDLANLDIGPIIKTLDENNDPYWGMGDKTVEEYLDNNQEKYLYYYDINPNITKAMNNGDYSGVVMRYKSDNKIKVGYLEDSSIYVINFNGNNIYVNIDEMKYYDIIALITLLANIITNRVLEKKEGKCLSKKRSIENAK